MTETITLDSGQETAREAAERLVHDLLRQAERTEAASRRNGWDTSVESAVYPGGALVDSLLDIRTPLVSCADTESTRIVDNALREFGRRPGACTTTEVRELCSRLLRAIDGTRSNP